MTTKENKPIVMTTKENKPIVMIIKENKPIVILLSCAFIFFLSFLVFINIMVVPNKKFDITLTKNTLDITGKNGVNLNLDNIIELNLLNSAPSIILNGGGQNGNIIYGHNYMKNLGFTECYINNAKGKVIYIKTTTNQFLIGLDNNTLTQNLYNKLLSDVPSKS
ncbi:hypothetical protein [Clostridium thermobutyricum]|uniref:hypothetical protein n=1 Tax=Clostridium thermobutyricum TaxID=29372 RepID=UPI0018A8CB3A|nr:hypothetical protein [Clostridium thermobutyricum]